MTSAERATVWNDLAELNARQTPPSVNPDFKAQSSYIREKARDESPDTRLFALSLAQSLKGQLLLELLVNESIRGGLSDDDAVGHLVAETLSESVTDDNSARLVFSRLGTCLDAHADAADQVLHVLRFLGEAFWHYTDRAMAEDDIAGGCALTTRCVFAFASETRPSDGAMFPVKHLDTVRPATAMIAAGGIPALYALWQTSSDTVIAAALEKVLDWHPADGNQELADSLAHAIAVRHEDYLRAHPEMLRDVKPERIGNLLKTYISH